jgi:hypothetical protein
MQWTYATVDAFFHNADSVQPTMDRLLANQADIGAAIVPFYSQEAADQLTELLTTHINDAVPVLPAAQSADDPALQAALDDWYANAQEVADFLAAADPDRARCTTTDQRRNPRWPLPSPAAHDLRPDLIVGAPSGRPAGEGSRVSVPS